MSVNPRMTVIGNYDAVDWFGEVFVDGKPLSPARSQKLFNHSPDGFAWGYAGSGPAQLALALLLEAGLSDDDAVRWHQLFKSQLIAPLARDTFQITINVEEWLERAQLRAAERRASDE